MGGSVKYGDDIAGARVKEYVCNSLEEVLELPSMDLSKGRISEVLSECKKLREEGKEVVLQISGPFTILNILIDPKYVFRGMRKTPELIEQIYDKIKINLLRYVDEAVQYGVEIISYADSAGGVNILGPKVAEQVIESFTYPFLKEVEKKNVMTLLCPKTTFALLDTGKAKFVDIELEESMYYGEACLTMKRDVKFAGQTCIKNTSYRLENKLFKKVELL